MPASKTVPCPECGALNRVHRKTCRLCGALLNPAATNKPRLQKKILRRTDFIAASRANQSATRKLVMILLAIAAVLGYLIGWTAQVSMGEIPAQAKDPLLFFSQWGLIASLILITVSLLWTWIAFKRGDRIVMKMTGAQLASMDEEQVLYNVVDEMALAAGVSRPTVYIIETDAMNAFATGMSPARASLGVTRGLLNNLSRDELQGVIGHEMGHIVNWDIRYATAVSVLVGLIALISDSILRSMYYGGGTTRHRGGGRGKNNGAAILFVVMIVFAVLAPLIARLVQMAVSRQREFLADASSVRLTRNPHGLISALEKLSGETVQFKGANRATQHLFIINPFRNFTEKASSLMSTHPPLERRIQRLRNLGGK
ncbi:MAG TPA: zinc metalloprotease HtpX [Gammaproteobacteria bacterium]|nr:zinc metalloprotease HtpX [Gammaproteobacteria bacterium]